MSAEDDLPSVVCQSCVSKLDVLHRFREDARRSEEALKQFLASPDVIPDHADVSNRVGFKYYSDY